MSVRKNNFWSVLCGSYKLRWQENKAFKLAICLATILIALFSSAMLSQWFSYMYEPWLHSIFKHTIAQWVMKAKGPLRDHISNFLIFWLLHSDLRASNSFHFNNWRNHRNIRGTKNLITNVYLAKIEIIFEKHLHWKETIKKAEYLQFKLF